MPHHLCCTTHIALEEDNFQPPVYRYTDPPLGVILRRFLPKDPVFKAGFGRRISKARSFASLRMTGLNGYRRKNLSDHSSYVRGQLREGGGG
ncbi:MAG: hypothetical protein A3G87_09900 [Omnitrophica bacterium RIFCSPLOWO2_12_FULL_50_11]|nr:MAG: hypothetical protein A3G87_09900 [Omnitrophica bacterium RIFCSPLOWO2_12_FULL_50_11]